MTPPDRWLDFPFRFDGRGLTADTSWDDHVRDLIRQVLLTSPGERVMRPDWGGGVLQLVFAGNSPELAASTQFIVQSSLQSALGDLIAVEGVEVVSEDATLTVVVRYVNRRSRNREVLAVPAPVVDA
ncbi:MAG: GPW/gp25 family protein [Dehalococcoidia bacterium]|nr:GPW/gp25 family protein [Dehalococcoidia bacterium]